MTMSVEYKKPLGRKAYGSIGHLPGSRMGPGDHACPLGYQRICCDKSRDKRDVIYCQEKYDGSCVAVARIGDELHALGRAGWPATSSPFEQHRLWHNWAMERAQRFFAVLLPGERLVGEWLAQAHGTQYLLGDMEPFVAFDLMRDDKRATHAAFVERVSNSFATPSTIPGPVSIERALAEFQAANTHGAVEPIEGVVYRVERDGRVDFLAKYVRPDKVDGHHLPELTGKPAVWNWRPPLTEDGE